MAMTQKERMLAGELYVADDPELVEDAARAAAWCDRYNRAATATSLERHALLVKVSGTPDAVRRSGRLSTATMASTSI
ncbi:maltose acetyltransferase domain-containing protein [Sphingomonas aerolata]|uniref:maltose acetyltransferase domain-containing protein n=1 Tax=Sphingomonas aerolata TaxID=185951 RepID=UPI002FE169F9